MAENSIPADLILNWDQRDMRMVLVNVWTMTTRGCKRVSVTGLGDKRDTFFSNKCPFLNWLYTSTVDLVLRQKKGTKKSTIAKRVGQITPMCDPKTTRAYCCTKPNWIGSSTGCGIIGLDRIA